MSEESLILSILSRAAAFGTPLLWASLGEICAERSGVINLGVEGMMILGAFAAFATAYTTGSPWLGVLAAAIVGGIAAFVHAGVTITLRANQYVSGLALTMLGLGLAGLLGRGWEGRPLLHALPDITVPGLAQIPFLGPALFTDQSLLTYMGFCMAIALWFVLTHTRWGIIIRSVGEAPAAVDAQGLPVYMTRYGCVIFGGMLAGVAGSFLSVSYLPAWTTGITGGMGWIALALTIFAAWDALRAIAVALLFGALYHLSFRLQAWIAPELLKLMPYACTIAVLALTAMGKSKRGQGGPAALGRPYIRGQD
ncbi:MAG: ABC transporter permease [Candidatus Entotheonella factor]|uniref:ABC transporter permease n=1 Tax=Entotheonella factor TaxID=1429438 RepID=W4LPQ6_ENTF1|nr:MAG: ABC transporter permease [Candidatus Entotheonella factor]